LSPIELRNQDITFCHCCNKELDNESKSFCNHCESGEHSEKSFCIINKKNIALEKSKSKDEKSMLKSIAYDFQKIREDVRKQPEIKCSFCDDGYYNNGGNDVKCDHCKGTGICKGTIHNSLTKNQPNPCRNCIVEDNAEVDRSAGFGERLID
jgi:hypothetical protein